MASTPPYKVWVVLDSRNDNKGVPGEEIKSAYCKCPAGFLGTCNNVAGMVFRVEQAVAHSYTKSSCNDRLCGWVHPGKASKVPGKVRDVVIYNEK